MKATTVRRLDGTILCFGPDDGMYQPNYDPATCTRQVEPKYDVVLAEWQQRPVAEPATVAAKRRLKSAKTVADLVTLLEEIL